VLAPARRCRYCGYRFDGAPREAPAARAGNALTELLFGTRWHSSPQTPSEIVAGWGIPLLPGESVAVLAFGNVTAHHGYLVVTDRRFVFVEHQGSRAYRVLAQWPLETVVEVTLGGRRRSDLRVRGASYDLTVHGLDRETAQHASAALSAMTPGG
jgi:hypothetical protein